MATMETKTAPAAVVAGGSPGHAGEGSIIKGFLSVFDVPDLVGDITYGKKPGGQPGTFTKTIAENPQPPLMWQHRTELPPIGKVINMAETSEGVFFRAKLAPGVQLADEIGALVKMGAVTGVSFGYNVDRSSATTKSGKRYRSLDSVTMLEVSCVNFPAHPMARLQGIEGKAWADMMLIGEVECLRACGVAVPGRKMVEYIDATTRQDERRHYGWTKADMTLHALEMLARIDAELVTLP